MSKVDLSALHEGDIVKATRTLRVTSAQECGLVRVVDVADGTGYRLFGGGSVRIDMVKRAVRKPKVGDVLNGRQVRETKWRRGTLLRGPEGHSLFDPPVQPGVLFVLTAEGLWFSTETERSYGFDDVHNEELLEVVYLP